MFKHINNINDSINDGNVNISLIEKNLPSPLSNSSKNKINSNSKRAVNGFDMSISSIGSQFTYTSRNIRKSRIQVNINVNEEEIVGSPNYRINVISNDT